MALYQVVQMKDEGSKMTLVGGGVYPGFET